MRYRKTVLVTSLSMSLLAIGASTLWSVLSDSPSARYSKSCVSRILFPGGRGRALLSNHFREVYATDSDGKSWRRVARNVHNLTLANGTELWGCDGWTGIHEGPSATVWFSPDSGRTWSETELELPSSDGDSMEVRRRLPAVFINEPADPALLLMYDYQLMRPKPNAPFESWTRVGKPIPNAAGADRPEPMLSGVKHSTFIYVATEGHMYMSADDAQTWSDVEVHQFQEAHISCARSACYALLSQLGSAWSGLMVTALGSNAWTALGTLDNDAVRVVLQEHTKRQSTIKTFAATALLPTEDGVMVTGITNAGGNSWGAALLLSFDGKLQSLPGSVDGGLWEVAQAPDGRIWVGGIGAYQRTTDGWIRKWSSVP